MQEEQSTPDPSARTPEETARREALRKKGAEYFEQILAKTSEVKDPVRASPGRDASSQKPEDRITNRGSHPRTIDIEKLDPDLETVPIPSLHCLKIVWERNSQGVLERNNDLQPQGTCEIRPSYVIARFSLESPNQASHN